MHASRSIACANHGGVLALWDAPPPPRGQPPKTAAYTQSSNNHKASKRHISPNQPTYPPYSEINYATPNQPQARAVSTGSTPARQVHAPLPSRARCKIRAELPAAPVALRSLVAIAVALCAHGL